MLVEDSGLLRDALTRLLADHEIDVVAFDRADDIVAQSASAQAEVHVLDGRLPPTFSDEGVRAAIELKTAHPDARILLLSQYVEERYARELLQQSPAGIGYLLKDRVADGREFVDALRRVAAGGTVLDPEVIAQLLTRRDPLTTLSPREREVLSLMAQGRSNSAIARSLSVSDGAVEKHVGNILVKLHLEPSDEDHRRVRAVLAWLGG